MGVNQEEAMSGLKEAAQEFLSHRRFAVAGVSRATQDAANVIYKRMRELKYEVYPVNPNADVVEGDRCYHSVGEAPGPLDGVVIVTHPAAAADVVAQCAAAGVPRVWIHRSIGGGSLSPEAVAACEKAGIAVLAGGCPMMHMEPVDFGHKCMRAFFTWTGKLPDGSGYHLPQHVAH